MALPQIDVQTFNLNVSSLQKEFKFRPFLVKEEKLLVMANESSDSKDVLSTAQQIITNCSFGKVDGDKLPLFDVQKVFLQLRSQSVGSIITLNVNCGECDAEIEAELDLDDVEVKRLDEHKDTFNITDNIAIEMKYPRVDEVHDLIHATEEMDIYIVAANNIKTIYTEDEVIDFQSSPPDERVQWIENLTPDQFKNIKEFFETMPQLYHTIEFKCRECKKDNYLNIDGYENFFV